MKKIATWKYQITWYTSDRQPFLEAEIQGKIIELVEGLCEESSVYLESIRVTTDTLILTIESKSQINMSKLLKQIQKKIGKFLSKTDRGIKNKKDLWDQAYHIVSLETSGAELDVRIEKVLDHLWSAEYYDLDEGVTDELGPFKRYLETRTLGVIEKGEQCFFIDIESITKAINLNCFECTKIHKYGCCSGSPCDLSVKNRKTFERHRYKLIEEMKKLDEQYYKKVEALGGFLDEKGRIRECEGRCVLLINHEGSWKCLLHKYALEQKLAPYEICPLSCLMYPLEIIELITSKQKKVLLLTSAIDENFAKEYGRWGSYKDLEVELRCIHPEAHNEIFHEKDYRPVYQVNEQLIRHEFGEVVYQGIETLIDWKV